MKVLWEGRYLDGHTSTPWKATVRPLKNVLRITLDEGTVLDWPYDQVRQVQGHYSGEPVRLERGEEPCEVLVVQDIDFLNTLRAKSVTQAHRFHNPGFRKTRLWLTVYAGIASCLVAFIFYHWGIPALAEVAAEKVPLSWEKGMGAGEVALLAPKDRQVHNARLDADIKRIVARLKSALPGCPYSFQVTVCNTPMVNAMSLPGGTIVVFQGLLVRTRTPEELAGVLSHEMQHVVKRHITKQIIQDSSLGLLVSLLAGDTTGSVAAGLQSAKTFALLSYSRGDEAEADSEGMKTVMAAGIDPQGMIRFFDELNQDRHESALTKYLSTHPATNERIADLKAVMKAVWSSKTPLARKAVAPLLPGENWVALVKSIPKGKDLDLDDLWKNDEDRKDPKKKK